MKQTLRTLGSRAIETLSRYLPKSAHVVVHGFPNDEGNAVEVVRALLRRYRGTVYWLVDDRRRWMLTEQAEQLQLLEKKSIKAVFIYATAESVFFTHGLYGDARPGPNATFVNLWHGDGFKTKEDAEASKRSLYPAHFVVGGTRLLTARKALDFKMAPETAIVCGNPRIDQFGQGLPLTLFRRITGDCSSPFVVWLPTFRRRNQEDAAEGSPQASENDDLHLNAGMQRVIDLLRAAGIQVVVKPHPLDKDARSVKNAHILSNDDLGRAGTTLYALLGASSGLITDYSSVWTDYLVLDRPIAYFVPDLAAYPKTRGIFINDLFDWVPGPLLHMDESIMGYADEILAASTASASRRADAAIKLGLAPAGCVSDRLLSILDSAGAFSKAGALRRGRTHKEEIPHVLLRSV